MAAGRSPSEGDLRRCLHLRRHRLGAVLVLTVLGTSALFATTAMATPSRTSNCSNCHDGRNIPVTATLVSNSGAAATYSLSAPTAEYIAVFSGTTKVAQVTGASGSVTVANGQTYTIYSASGPGTSGGLGLTTVSPAAPVVAPDPPVVTPDPPVVVTPDPPVVTPDPPVVTPDPPVVVPGPTPEPPVVGVDPSKLKIKAGDDRVRKGKKLTLKGELRPADGDDTVEIYVMKPGSSEWELLGTVDAFAKYRGDDDDDRDGDDARHDQERRSKAKWSYKFSSGSKGTYRFQARFAGDADTAAAISRTIKVKVR